jgi:hypothetical protein
MADRLVLPFPIGGNVPAMNLKTTLVPGLVAAAAVAGSAAMASASTAQPHVRPLTVHARTLITDHQDSGGNGNWANDTIVRDLTITKTGGNTYTATVKDTGTFRTDRGAYTPNQGRPYTGRRIRGQVSGPLAGEAHYSFTASKLPDFRRNASVPGFLRGPVSGARTTSLWFEQAFPAGTKFGGPGIGAWSWKYQGPTCKSVVTVIRHHHKVEVPVYTRQHWTDSSANKGGQVPSAGNITGRC